MAQVHISKILENQMLHSLKENLINKYKKDGDRSAYLDDKEENMNIGMNESVNENKVCCKIYR